uniref:DUF4920 domain-containing protein n=1 Tax=Flavobacterium sp. TaxID=239 RepID=UPI00404A98C2
MKKVILVAFAGILFTACKKENNEEVAAMNEEVFEEVNYASFGDSISAEGLISKDSLYNLYASMETSDTITVKFASTIQEVCSKKGCWMNVDLAEEKNAFVRFKDYGFFMPLNAAGSEVVVEGKAFMDVVSVDDLKHFAKDANKTQEEIDAITEPKITYAFTANGVLIKE